MGLSGASHLGAPQSPRALRGRAAALEVDALQLRLHAVRAAPTTPGPFRMTHMPRGREKETGRKNERGGNWVSSTRLRRLLYVCVYELGG